MDNVPLNHEWADILKSFPITRYAPLNTLQTTRGCRFNCDFCSVIRINGRGSRHSPTDRIVEELKVLKRVGQHVGEWAYVFFLDDDLAADLDFCGELSEAILSSGVKVKWGAQASIGLARNQDLLGLATRSGLRTMFVGFEGIDRASLLECNKKNRPGEYGELVARVHQAGAGIEGGFIFGFDSQGPDCFEETATFVDNIGVDVAHFSILTPYPGTATYARMLSDGRITSFDWKRYNMYSCVYQPARMTAAQLEAGLATAYRAFYSRKRRVNRFRRFAKGREKAFHLALAAANHNYATRYKHPGAHPGTATRPTPTTSRACWRPAPPPPRRPSTWPSRRRSPSPPRNKSGPPVGGRACRATVGVWGENRLPSTKTPAGPCWRCTTTPCPSSTATCLAGAADTWPWPRTSPPRRSSPPSRRCGATPAAPARPVRGS